MPSLKIYDLFISHAWFFYGRAYNRVVEFLNDTLKAMVPSDLGGAI
jgi:hypothetical protein